MDHLPAVASVVGGLLSLVDPIPYIRDTLRGRTHPHRGTWLIWSVLACVALSAQWAQDGAVGSWAPQLLLYAVYLTVVDVVTASLILGRRRVLTPRRAVRPRGAAGSGALPGSA